MVSHSQEEDRKARLMILEVMKTALRLGKTEDAKELGISARKIGERMKTKDYSRQDAFEEKLKNLSP